MRRNLAIFGAVVVSLGMAAPASSQQQEGWSATLESESDPGLPLAWVTALAVDSRGRVYVTDNALDGIAVLAPEQGRSSRQGRMRNVCGNRNSWAHPSPARASSGARLRGRTAEPRCKP